MNREEFLNKIKDLLDVEELDYGAYLGDVEEWDSISIISIAAFLNNGLGKSVTVNELKSVQTVDDLAKMAGVDE